MIELPKHSDLLKLPELLYGKIKKVGVLNNEPILYGDVNLLKLDDLFYFASAHQIYRYVGTRRNNAALPILPGIGIENPIGGGVLDPIEPQVVEYQTSYIFEEVEPMLDGFMSNGLTIPDELRGTIKRAGKLFDKIIYSGDPNLVKNGNLYYHEAFPLISTVGINDGVITLSANWIGMYGNVSTMVTEYRVSPQSLHDYSKDYLTLEALESGVFNVRLLAYNSSELTSLSYSLDKGNTWTTSTNVQEVSGRKTYYTIEVTTPTVNNGDKVLWKGDVTYNNTASCYFGGTNIDFNVSGNPFSLFEDDDFKTVTEITDGRLRRLFRDSNVVSAENLSLFATTLTDDCYVGMFSRCTSLTTAPVLPATTLAIDCYSGMFFGCASLTTAPKLPATTLADYCYGGKDDLSLPFGMFEGCTSLTTAPTLSAPTLNVGCYRKMFKDCTSLTTAPELPATTLAQECYVNMFYGCSKLNYIKAMFSTTPGSSYTTNWVSGVAANGTFVKNSAAQWDVTGANGVPSGWTVETASS